MTTYTVGSTPVTVTDRGEGPVFLLLHGGGGPQSVAAFADQLADARQARVIAPTHPGFDGTPRPDSLTSVHDLATLYVDLLATLDLHDVTVVGNSVGGWITAEMALADSSRIGRIVLVDAVGIDVPEHPVVDFFGLALNEIADFSYHNPDAYRIDPTAMSTQQQAVMAGNRAALATYGGTAMTDPTLRDRLAGITVPTLVLWGESDRIVDPDFGRAYAAAIPGSSFLILPDTGHLPQIETPEALLRAIGTGAVRIVGPTDGEITLTSPIRMRILEDGSTTGHRLGIGEITIQPHTDGPLQHRHAQHDEGFYVVAGTVRFTVGQTSHDATAGTLVMVPPGAPHTFANPGDVPAVVLNTFTPDFYVNYFRDLRAMIEGGQSMTPAANADVMARYATEPV